jgi:hypothetical protein
MGINLRRFNVLLLDPVEPRQDARRIKAELINRLNGQAGSALNSPAASGCRRRELGHVASVYPAFVYHGEDTIDTGAKVDHPGRSK